jgi:hypothetical protein
MDLRPGDTVFGPSENEKYTVTRLIGGGGFGIVYETQRQGQSFALKTLTTAGLTDTALQTLINEGG